MSAFLIPQKAAQLQGVEEKVWSHSAHIRQKGPLCPARAPTPVRGSGRAAQHECPWEEAGHSWPADCQTPRWLIPGAYRVFKAHRDVSHGPVGPVMLYESSSSAVATRETQLWSEGLCMFGPDTSKWARCKHSFKRSVWGRGRLWNSVLARSDPAHSHLPFNVNKCSGTPPHHRSGWWGSPTSVWWQEGICLCQNWKHTGSNWDVGHRAHSNLFPRLHFRNSTSKGLLTAVSPMGEKINSHTSDSSL